MRTARYINAQRGFFFGQLPPVYPNTSKYYTHADQPAYFDADSTELWSVYTIEVVSSFVFGFGVGLLAHFFGAPEMAAILAGLGVWLISAGGQLAFSAWYLRTKEKQPG